NPVEPLPKIIVGDGAHQRYDPLVINAADQLVEFGTGHVRNGDAVLGGQIEYFSKLSVAERIADKYFFYTFGLSVQCFAQRVATINIKIGVRIRHKRKFGIEKSTFSVKL